MKKEYFLDKYKTLNLSYTLDRQTGLLYIYFVCLSIYIRAGCRFQLLKKKQ